MTIVQLKDAISKKTFDNFPLIIKYSDNNYLANHYVKQYFEVYSEKQRVDITSLDELGNNDDFFESTDNTIYVYEVEKLEEDIEPDKDNLIVICKEIKVNLSVDYVDFPKVVNWQAEDYVRSRLPGLDEVETSWLCDISKYNLFRLDQECKKLEIFAKPIQKVMFQEMNLEDAYSDLNSNNIFNFTDAIMNRDYKAVGELIPEIGTCDLEPLGVVTILLKKFLQIANLQMNPKATASSLGMTDKQFNYLRHNPNTKFTQDQIKRNIEFLSDIDYKVKTGLLEFSANTPKNREELLAYFVVNVLA